MTRAWTRLATVLVVAGVLLAGCAAGPNVATEGEAANAGFWLGLWHGVISPITFLISLFNDDVNIYEVRNNGNWYDFGFILGVMVIFSGSRRSGGAASRRRRRRQGDN